MNNSNILAHQCAFCFKEGVRENPLTRWSNNTYICKKCRIEKSSSLKVSKCIFCCRESTNILPMSEIDGKQICSRCEDILFAIFGGIHLVDSGVFVDEKSCTFCRAIKLPENEISKLNYVPICSICREKYNTFSQGIFIYTNGNDTVQIKCIVCGAESSIDTLLFPANADAYICNKCIDFGVDLMERSGACTIRRTISIKPKYAHVFVSMLSYFSKIIQDKYPDIPIFLTIQQKCNTIEITIKTPDGKTEIIEETLNDYCLVLRGRKNINDFLHNDRYAENLQRQLDFALSEINHLRELYKLNYSQHDARIRSIEDSSATMHKMINVHASNNGLALTILSRIENFQHNDTDVKSALLSIAESLRDRQDNFEVAIIEALNNIKNKDKVAFTQIANLLTNTLGSYFGSSLFNIIKI